MILFISFRFTYEEFNEAHFANPGRCHTIFCFKDPDWDEYVFLNNFMVVTVRTEGLPRCKEPVILCFVETNWKRKTVIDTRGITSLLALRVLFY